LTVPDLKSNSFRAQLNDPAAPVKLSVDEVLSDEIKKKEEENFSLRRLVTEEINRDEKHTRCKSRQGMVLL